MGMLCNYVTEFHHMYPSIFDLIYYQEIEIPIVVKNTIEHVGIVMMNSRGSQLDYL